MKAEDILMDAANLVSGDRKEQHGDAAASWQMIADLWSARLGVTVTAPQALWMMTDVKYSRSVYGQHKADDYMDGCGYIALAGQVKNA